MADKNGKSFEKSAFFENQKAIIFNIQLLAALLI
jgi:hypothetical protein